MLLLVVIVEIGKVSLSRFRWNTVVCKCGGGLVPPLCRNESHTFRGSNRNLSGSSSKEQPPAVTSAGPLLPYPTRISAHSETNDNRQSSFFVFPSFLETNPMSFVDKLLPRRIDCFQIHWMPPCRGSWILGTMTTDNASSPRDPKQRDSVLRAP